MKDGVLEESFLVLPFVTQMVIDSDRQHILTNYKKGNDPGKAVDSDHFSEYMDLNLEVIKEKPERLELFNFKEKESQDKFRVLTSETTNFTECSSPQW